MGGGSSGSWSRLGDIRSLEEKAKAALQGENEMSLSVSQQKI